MVVRDRFRQVNLIIPRTSEYHKGVYSYHALSLIGTRTPFKIKEYSSIIPLDSKKIYIVYEGSNCPIPFLPFIVIDSNSHCYFYLGRDNDSIRWESYHFESDTQPLIDDADTHDILKQIVPQKSKRKST